ncbi:protein ABSCISIC ACID-INSENSITIVE 5 [Dorcoceras hygrometricum]|uniref:Protein ABSCISIC ACID-INSENSITIVE 5 n=1 Tax=Dorcoceras hygrometricum TaxID=472368 RepID=A0A2Z7CW81_9LAMI|nr:protein ABSCISIC ACID-INSENSITIVE 5 [Dorcoceras hygrometricum]
MVTSDTERKSPGEVESSSQSQSKHQQSKKQPLQSLGRQSSVYSLTLDEFQNTLCEGGKSFGSMNMDEFLNSIWTAEEQTQTTMNAANAVLLPHCEANLSAYKGAAKQSSLQRQGSLSLPEPLCRKTVDEVWSEIHRSGDGQTHAQNPNPAQRQRTFGEMTLEDFLVKAGIVQEQNPHSAPSQQPPSYGMYQNSNHTEMGPNFVARPVVGPYQPLPQSGGGEVSCGTKRGSSGQQTTAGNYGVRMGNGCGGYGQVHAGIGIGSPVSPVSSDGLCANQVDSSNQYGMDVAKGGRKRIVDGPVERVVERRQRRMIKNRESAARSRARKQAYTVELEAELNQLKEENELLKHALAELERKRKQQVNLLFQNPIPHSSIWQIYVYNPPVVTLSRVILVCVVTVS